MKLDNNLLTQINNYLDHKLPEDERQAFERDIAVDAALAEEVKRQSIIREAVLRTEYKALFKQIHQELAAQEADQLRPETVIQPQVPTRVLPLRWYHWAMAASVVLLLGLGWFFFVESPDTEALYATHFSAQPKQPSVRIDPEIMGSPSQSTERTDSIQVVLAIQLLQAAKVELAIESLQRVARNSGNYWGRVAEWYLALAFLKNNKPEDARKQLLTIVQDTKHPYFQESVAILNELDQ